MGAHDKSAFEVNKLSKRLHRLTGQAIIDFNMIEEGDRVMVCMSGGKDSYAMLDILLSLRERAPIDFEVIAVNLDQGHPGFPKETLPDYLRSRGVAFHIENQDTYSIVKRVIPEGKGNEIVEEVLVQEAMIDIDDNLRMVLDEGQ